MGPASDGGAGDGERFSIRGYAAGMRSGGAGRSRPLGREAGALPPMEVRRFRWWADEARAALTAEEEEGEEGRMTAKRRKRRKRSIVELFAAVPQVAGGGGEALGRGRRRRRSKDKCKEKATEKLVLGLKRKKGFKKGRALIEIGVGKKEKSIKQKISSLSISELFQDSMRKRKLRKSLSKKRSPEVTVLLGKDSTKLNPKSAQNNQKTIMNSCPVQSILKQQSRAGMGRLLNNIDVMTPLKSSCKLKKHVTFSGEDDIFGCTASAAGDNTEHSQLVQKSQQLSQEGDNPHNTHEPCVAYQQEIDATCGIIEDNASFISERVEPAGMSRTVPLIELKDLINDNHHQKERVMPGDLVDLNHCIQMSNSCNCLNYVSSTVLSSQTHTQSSTSVVSHQMKGSNLDVGCHAEENSHMALQGRSLPISLATKASLGDLIRSPVSQPLSSCLVTSLEVNDKNKSTSSLGEKLVPKCHLTEVHPRPLCSGKDVVNSISSSTGSNKSTDAQATDCVSVCRKMYFSDDYIGLPLNSQGEFVNMHPGSSTLSPNEIFRRQCLGQGSSGCLAFSDFVRPKTGMGCADIRIDHHAPPFYTVDSFGFHPEPYFTPMMPATYGLDFTQLPGFERMEVQNNGIPRNEYPFVNQNECSVKLFCSGCMEQTRQRQNLVQMQNFFPSHSYEQDIRPAAETTVRLMGKTVTLGTSSKQCRGLDNETLCSDKQIRAGDHCSERTYTKAFPQTSHGGLVDPRTYGTSNGGIQPSKVPSYFPSVPAAELRFGLTNDSFRMSGLHQQPQAAPSKLPVQPVTRYSEVELGHQSSSVATQIQNASEHMLLSSTHCKHTQSIATMSTPCPNGYRNFMEVRPAPSISSHPPKQFSNVSHRTPIFSPASGHTAQNTLDLMRQTKFTSSLPPLPPSVIPSHVYNRANAQLHRSSPIIDPSGTSAHPTSNSNTPRGAIYKDRGDKWSAAKSNLEGLELINRSCKRPAGKDGPFLTIPKKPRLAVEKYLNLLALPEKRPEVYGARQDTQTQVVPVLHNKEPEVDLQPVNNVKGVTWSGSVSRVKSGPVKLKAGAKHILQPSANMDQESSRPMHSTIPFPVENDACTVSTSRKRAAEIYRF